MNQEKLWNKLSKDRNHIAPFKEFRRSGYLQARKFIFEDNLLKDLRPFTDKYAMDIGCGIGRISEFMAYWFRTVFAVDISEKMLRNGRERIGYIKNLDFIKTDGQSVPQKLCHFVFSFTVLQHMRKPEIKKTFESVRKILVKGGIFKAQIRGLECEQGQWYSGDYYTEDEARELAKETGFEIIALDGVGKKYFWLWLK